MRISFGCTHIEVTAKNNLTYLRCCLASEFAKIADREYAGLACTESELFSFDTKLAMLNYLMQDVTWTELNYECLEVSQLEDIASYILNHCPDCERVLN